MGVLRPGPTNGADFTVARTRWVRWQRVEKLADFWVTGLLRDALLPVGELEVSGEVPSSPAQSTPPLSK